MSVLVKGMEMPKNCAECPCRMIGYTADYCNVLGKFIDVVVGSDGRREDCPLVPVPPHGRLIDAGNLGARAFRYLLMSGEESPKVVFAQAIKDAPTVIPADKDGET